VLVDLHAHYPMRVVNRVNPGTPARLARRRLARAGSRGGWFRALLLRVLSLFFNHRFPWSGYRVTPEGVRAGGVGVMLSVLTRPLDEFDLGKPYAWNPQAGYYTALLDDMEAVESDLREHGPELRLVRDRAGLDRAIGDGATAVAHCLEGGFSLGDRPADIERHVAELADRGVVYITLAHLIYRQMATNTNAIPFLSAADYDKFFPQPEGEGLTERGVAAIRAMVANRVMLDLSHMRQDALDETFALLDALDPDRAQPVLASHAGFRFGEQEYMLDEPTILQVKRRNGVVGLILAQHQLMDGDDHEKTTSFEDSCRVIFKHVDRIAEITEGYEHVAIGTDFDGFIKPTMTGLEGMKDLGSLERALDERYEADAALIKSENALRVLRQAMR
jgi:microsomal dipeptidase-like Zn-dependent dipeptidase